MEEDLEKRILEILREGPRTFEELVEALSWSGDKRGLRRVLAEMVKSGIIVKEPDYERRKMVFKVRGG
ncbi:MAG: hypothetical protein F7B17_05360 [Desulfurococcales archaeon]|nr:hypothetical protein [Desulfurococcales archaeon]